MRANQLFKLGRLGEMVARRVSFEVAQIQARRASEYIFTGIAMHSLARRAIIEDDLCFEFRSKIQRELNFLIKTVLLR